MATTPVLTAPGIGSGLDVNGIVQKLMTVEQRPLTLLDQKTAVDQAKITAFGSVKSALSALQTALQGLSTTASFRTLTATVADSSVLGASVGAGSSAVPGTYAVEVTQLAQAHKLVSAGLANITDAVGSGTLTFEFGSFNGTTFTAGSGGAKTVTIGVGQNTLAGIRDAVNAAGVGVTATIVNDGSAAGNRLVFTSAATGAANSMRITVADADGTNTNASGLSQLAYDPAAAVGSGRNLTQNVAAQDALLNIDGIAVRASSNTVSTAIDGVTLNLLKTNVGVPTTLTVAANTGSVGASVAAFVKAYNDLNTTFDNVTKYDATKKQASVLTGDSTVRVVQNQLRSLLGGSLGNGTYSTLSQVGVSFKADGTMALDSAKLNTALAANPAAVTQLFAATGSATDSAVSVTGFTAKTVPGTYALNVTQLATAGKLTGGAPASLAVTAGVNDQLTILLDGVTATVTLTAGIYANAGALATEVQSKINGAAAFSAVGSSVTATQAGGVLTLTSNRYGSASAVSASGSAATGLFGAAPTAATGVNAAATLGGTVLLGSGRTLLGPAGTPLEGLTLNLSGGALGARGTVTYQTGFAYRLNELVKGLVATDGVVATRTDGLQRDITDIGKRRDALNVRLALVEANYRAQFNALDTLLSSLSAQSSYLQQQLASLPKF